MKKMSLPIVILLILTNCAGSGVSAGHGAVFTSVIEGKSANNGVEIKKEGKACQLNILGVISSGDTSIKAAKLNGNIRNVATLDRTYFSFLSIYTRSCLVVKGD
jgi:hypothetical protein